MYKFRMPIGDWSDDGHGKCDYYTISSNLPIEEVREAHFKIPELTGVNIESIANNYEEGNITQETLDKLISLGVDPDKFDEPYKGSIYVSSENMRDIWITLLNNVEPKLNLVVEEKIPMLPFYGFDEQKRHIGFIGYGCF